MPLFNACAGRLSIVETVIKSGFPPAKVNASNIGLFSSLVGYLADDSKNFENLGIRILDPDLEPRDLRDELDFAAHIMLILKLNQLSQTNLRGLYLREELRRSWFRYREAVRDELAGLIATAKEERMDIKQAKSMVRSEIKRHGRIRDCTKERLLSEGIEVDVSSVKAFRRKAFQWNVLTGKPEGWTKKLVTRFRIILRSGVQKKILRRSREGR